MEWAPLDYLIGYDGIYQGAAGRICEVGYDTNRKPFHGQSIAYCNLFDEKNTGTYKPYLHDSDTASKYGEGQIDPRGAGWQRNLNEQFARRKASGFEYVELDNPDAYSIDDVLGAIDRAASYGLKVIAKNANLLGVTDAKSFLKHPNVYGCIVEKGAGYPGIYNLIRIGAGKFDMPIWFVFFGDGRLDAHECAEAITHSSFKNMSVTYSAIGEYGSSSDVTA